METTKRTFTLLELASSIQRAIQQSYVKAYWVKAEMHKLNLSASGHCFPELVQKQDGKIVAQMRGTIWKTQFTSIRRNFESVVKEPLKDGMTLLFSVQVKFDPIYGLSLLIVDIDPNYTLGELHRQREETLKLLKANQLLNKNQSLSLAFLPKNIAVISVDSSKGYRDFMTILKENEFGYGFNTHLFPAVLDGDRAAETIIQQLQRIKKYTSFFDAVVIVRGGGGEIGMTCYNEYDLCAEIANFPIPVLTGIGHSTNLTVAEMIAYKSAITPTKLGDFLIQTFRRFEISINDAKDWIVNGVRELLFSSNQQLLTEFRFFRNATTALLLSEKVQLTTTKKNLNKEIQRTVSDGKFQLKTISNQVKSGLIILQKMENIRIENLQKAFKSHSKRWLFTQHELLANLHVNLQNQVPEALIKQRKELERLTDTVRLLSPENLLKKGYSIALLNGKVVSESNRPQKGDTLETITSIGKLESIIQKTSSTGEENGIL